MTTTTPPRAYLLAAAAVAAALALRWPLWPVLGDAVPYMTFFPAVMLAAWAGGLRPGLLATALSAACAVAFVVGPSRAFSLRGDPHGAGLAAFVVAGTFVSALGEAQRRAAARASAEAGRSAASEGRLRLFVERAPAAVAMLDRDMRYLAASRRWAEDFGLGDAPLEGRSHYEVFPDLPERWREAHRRCLAGSVERCEEDSFVRPDGRTEYLRWELRPWPDGGGGVGGLLIFAEVITARKLAERALAEERERLRVTLSSIGDAVLAADAAGRVTFLNPVAEALTGWADAEAAGRPFSEVFRIVNEQTRQPADDPVGRVLREGVVGLANHTVLLRRGGGETPVEDSAAPIRDAGGGVAGVVLVFRDVSEKRRAEAEASRSAERAREGEERFHQLADSMPQIVWSARPDGEIDYLNRRWAEFTGLPETAGNEGWKQILHPDDAPEARARWAASLREGAPFEMEARLLDRRARAYRWHLIRTAPGRDREGRVARWFGTATDIDDRRRAGEASRFLADASAALAAVVDCRSTLQRVAALAVPHFADWCAVDAIEPDGSVSRLAVAHADPEKVRLAHELHQRYPPDPDSPHGAAKVLRTGEPDVMEDIPDELLVKGARDEGHLRVLRELGLKSYVCVPLRARGKVIAAVSFVSAESGRRYGRADLEFAVELGRRASVALENAELYADLRDADRRKDEFLATLAHELRNPLAPIRNGLQVLKLADDPAARERAREMMERQLAQMVRLVDDLLDISRITRGKLELKKARVELRAVVENAVETARPQVEAGGHSLAVSLPAEPVYLDADLTRLSQVFWNLLNNAARYTEPGGSIALTAEAHGGEAVVTVKDTGIGIPAEALPGLFEMFSQIDRSLERAQGGLGIGLALVKGLTQMHGGSVEAHSDGPGRGSAFAVRLPVAPDLPQRRQPERQKTDVPAPGRRVLVVDDNRDGAASLAMLLSLSGHDARTAHDGLEALEVAEAFRPDLIVLDIGLPKLNGYDACRRIRERPWGRGVVIVAATGWGQEEDVRRSKEAGFDHHHVKPVDINALMKLLAELQAAKV